MEAIHIWNLEEIRLKMTELEWPRQQILIGGCHFVGHLGYRMSDIPVFELEREVDGSNPYMEFGGNLIKDRRTDGQAENNRAPPTFVGGALIIIG